MKRRKLGQSNEGASATATELPRSFEITPIFAKFMGAVGKIIGPTEQRAEDNCTSETDQ